MFARFLFVYKPLLQVKNALADVSKHPERCFCLVLPWWVISPTHIRALDTIQIVW